MSSLSIVPPATRDDVLRVISRTRLFRGLDPAFLDRLAWGARIHRFAQGDHPWLENQPAEHFHVVLRGVLELQRMNGGGGTSLVAFFGPGEAAGVPLTLERGRFIATSQAATPTLEVLRVSAVPVLEALPSDPGLAMAMNRALLDECRLLRAKADVLAAGAVPSRLAALLLDLVERFGDEHEDGTHFVPLALSRSQLATYVCARVETVIRVCTAWKRSGLVETTPDGFTISCLHCLRDVFRGAPRDEVAMRLASGCG